MCHKLCTSACPKCLHIPRQLTGFSVGDGHSRCLSVSPLCRDRKNVIELAAVAHFSNPSSREIETGRRGVQGHPWVHTEDQSSLAPMGAFCKGLKQERGGWGDEKEKEEDGGEGRRQEEGKKQRRKGRKESQ